MVQGRLQIHGGGACLLDHTAAVMLSRDLAAGLYHLKSFVRCQPCQGS